MLRDFDERLEKSRTNRSSYSGRRLGRLRREVYDELRSMRAIEDRMRRSRVSLENLKSAMDKAIDEVLPVEPEPRP